MGWISTVLKAAMLYTRKREEKEAEIHQGRDTRGECQRKSSR